MAAATALVAVLKDSALKKAFEAAISKRGLDKPYELARVHKDPLTVIQIYFANFTAKERDFCPAVYRNALPVFQKLSAAAQKAKLAEIARAEGQARALTDAEAAEVNLRARQSSEWAAFTKNAKIRLNLAFSEFCEKELPHTPEYAAYARKKAAAEAAKLAKEHEMDKEIDEWLGLSVAVATGDDKSAATISKRLSKSHKPKKGKSKSAGDLFAAAKTRMAKIFHLA